MTGGAEAAPPLTFHYAISFALHKLFFLQIVTLLKPIHTSAGINEFLSAREIGVALIANINLHRIALLGRTGFERCAASAGYRNLVVIGMDIIFHIYTSVLFP